MRHWQEPGSLPSRPSMDSTPQHTAVCTTCRLTSSSTMSGAPEGSFLSQVISCNAMQPVKGS